MANATGQTAHQIGFSKQLGIFRGQLELLMVRFSLSPSDDGSGTVVRFSISGKGISDANSIWMETKVRMLEMLDDIVVKVGLKKK